MELRIASDVVDGIVAAAAATREEVCGLLLGRGDRIDAMLACRNVAADRARRFEIDPAVLLGAHRAARAGGPEILGCYHSHPGSGSNAPSQEDARAAAPDGSVWLIVADGRIGVYRAVENGERFGRFDPIGHELA